MTSDTAQHQREQDETARRREWPQIKVDGVNICFRARGSGPKLLDNWSLYGSVPRVPAELQALIERARAAFPAGDVRVRIVAKLLRRELHLLRTKDWDQVLPREIVTWANRRLAGLAEGESCVDNWRVARRGNTSQLRRYRQQQKHGCCGFADVEELCPIDGRRYLLGFNYGH